MIFYLYFQKYYRISWAFKSWEWAQLSEIRHSEHEEAQQIYEWSSNGLDQKNQIMNPNTKWFNLFYHQIIKINECSLSLTLSDESQMIDFNKIFLLTYYCWPPVPAQCCCLHRAILSKWRGLSCLELDHKLWIYSEHWGSWTCNYHPSIRIIVSIMVKYRH